MGLASLTRDFGAAFDTAAAVMSEEALAEREHTRTGFADVLANGDVVVTVDGQSNAVSKKKVGLETGSYFLLQATWWESPPLRMTACPKSVVHFRMRRRVTPPNLLHLCKNYPPG